MSHLQSISVIKFGPGNVLLVGDGRAATLFAFELGEAPAASESRAFNVYSVDEKIADLLGAPVDHIAVKGLAIHPATKEAYIAVHRGHGDKMIPAIVKVNQAGEIHPVDLESKSHTKLSLQNPVKTETQLTNDSTPVISRALSITDIEVGKGELFVAGLSSAEFSSTLYRIPFPFNDTATTSSIEMYHAVHNQNETRAPIQTMAIVSLGGAPHVLAAYVCTPLVTIPVGELSDGAHVKGKTIGELGYGNAPIDIVPFQTQDMQGHVQEQVLITHRNRGPMLFNLDAIAQSNAKDGLTAGVGFSVVAPEHTAIPMAGLVHVDDQDQQYLASLRRDLETGRLQLISFRKGAFFRLTDFFSEYVLPGYIYDEAQKGTQQFQNLLKKDEGFSVRS